MSLLSGDVIVDAIQLSYPYVWEPGISYGSLFRQLTQLDREVGQIYAQQAPERISVSQSITVVKTQNPTGYPLVTGTISYTNFKWVDSEGFVWPINIVPDDRLDHPGQHPAGIVKGSTFFPADPVEMRWTGGDVRQFYVGDGDLITYDYVLFSVKVTSLSQTLNSPDEARDFLVAQLALNVLLGVGSGVPQEVVQYAVQRAERSRQDLYLNVMKRTDTRGRFADNKG